MSQQKLLRLYRIGKHYIANIKWLFMQVLFHASGLTTEQFLNA